jgi:hypothetical protein
MSNEIGIDGADAPTTFTHDALHSVLNQLALVVSYADLLLGELPAGDSRAADLLQIQASARNAARLLGRPLDGS